MEYFIKDFVMALLSQRKELTDKFISLDQNCNNYQVKQADINFQISQIDMKINDMIYAVKDFNITELNIKNNGK